MLYDFCHIPVYFAVVIFEVRSCELFPWGWVQNNIFPISASHLARITGVSLWLLI
jgi:hypothetical protein